MTPSPTDFQSLVQERKRKATGIEFARAYRALIRGFLRTKTPSQPQSDQSIQEQRIK